jgi:hypothetical protein
MMALILVAGVTGVLAQEAAPAAAAPAAVVPAEESPDTGLSVSATLDVYSAYVWRGAVVNDRPVWQPAATVSYATGDYGTFSGNVWGNFDMTDRRGHTKFAGINEIDYTLSYAIDVGPVSLSAGHIWYTFPSVTGSSYGTSTREVYLTAQYNNDLVNPFVKAYYDYEYAEGFYVNAGVNKSIDISDQLSAGFEVSVGMADEDYMSAYFGSDGGFCDFNAALFASYAITDNISIGPRLAWMSLIDSETRDNVDDQEILWGGVNLAASF